MGRISDISLKQVFLVFSIVCNIGVGVGWIVSVIQEKDNKIAELEQMIGDSRAEIIGLMVQNGYAEVDDEKKTVKILTKSEVCGND